ncbi:BTB/POZ domain-containing protein At5g47800 isoform X2 [Rutidosis leptorrhynchoides]|uniref:BTB/POZ domain-containing protein At5g47800 isoform X2 n=1 Tax=Rutidosis leptorrhynchoides TaxID=125765 RepID=UPI003A9A057A
MKFMRLGNRPDTFYTEEATRTLISDLPSDLTVRVNTVTYLLHKFPLLQKCGLLQQLCSEKEDTTSVTMEFDDFPGGADAFELCAKFCYGIKIDLSAHNFMPAICAARFMRMTESFAKGNFISKLDVFFNSCILEGWKDSVVTLQTTERFFEWSDNIGIIRRCIDSVVAKILTQPSKVRWSYTYTRPGYEQKKHHKSAPKDWWTEDVADLNIDLFRCIINTVKSTNMLPPQLIGEALHVYARRWLPDVTKNNMPHPETSTASQTTQERSVDQKSQLEMIVSLIPEDKGSVSVGFLLRLLSTAKLLKASEVLIAQLINKCSVQLEEATINDLLLPSHDSSDHHMYDIELVQIVVEGFIDQCRKSYSRDESSLDVIRKVAKLVDAFLQVVSSDVNMPVQKVVSLANVLPEFARPEHDKLYKAISIYLNEHPQMSKEEKKHLCSILDCQKLSAAARAHAVKNERLPTRTIVQLLFFEHQKHDRNTITRRDSQQPVAEDFKNRLQLYSDKGPTEQDSDRRRSCPSNTSQRIDPESEVKSKGKKVIEARSEKVKEIIEEESKHDVTNVKIHRSKSEHGRRKGK